MKYLGIFAAVFVLAFIFSHTDATKTDVVRLFNPELKLSKKELLDLLERANLEEYGFKKTTETAIETDENGKRRLKETIRYMVTDLCSRALFWESILEQRLPGFDPKTLGLGKTFAKEMQSRTKVGDQKTCEFGLEIHLNQCRQPNNPLVKRASMSGDCSSWCIVCIVTKERVDYVLEKEI